MSEGQELYRSKTLSQALNPVLSRLFVLRQVDGVGYVLIVDEAAVCQVRSCDLQLKNVDLCVNDVYGFCGVLWQAGTNIHTSGEYS